MEKTIKEIFPKITDEQIIQILSTRVMRSISVDNLVDYVSFFNDLIELANNIGLDELIERMNQVDSPELFALLSPLIETEREIDEITPYRLQSQIEAVEGAIACPRCNSTRTVATEKQIRSGDESSTTFVSCLDCGAKSRVKG